MKNGTTTAMIAFWVASSLVIVSTSLLVLQLYEQPQPDVMLYKGVADQLARGLSPYRDFAFEYPPYSLLLFVLPRTVSPEYYVWYFGLLVLMVDSAVKCLLLRIGRSERHTAQQYLPTFAYCASLFFLDKFYLQRFDLFPAFLSVLAIFLFRYRNFYLAGCILSLAIGTKLYPVVLLPSMCFLAGNRSMARYFIAGVVSGLLPWALISIYLPWWQFAKFHYERGIQVESVYASVLWLMKYLRIIDVQWVRAPAWMELNGNMIDKLAYWARMFWVITVMFSVLVSCWVSTRRRHTLSIPDLSRLMLLPLTAFVAFGYVSCASYIIWLLPFACVAMLDGDKKSALPILFAAAATRLYFPSVEYATLGLTLFQTLGLLVRNSLLVISWSVLVSNYLGDCARIKGRKPLIASDAIHR